MFFCICVHVCVSVVQICKYLCATHFFFCFCQFNSRLCTYSWGEGNIMCSCSCLCSSFSLNWQFIRNAFIFCFMFVCFLCVCVVFLFYVCFGFFLCVLVFFLFLPIFCLSVVYLLKARSKTQEKSFNYIYNGIKINILICLGISVFFPPICFFLADLQ